MIPPQYSLQLVVGKLNDQVTHNDYQYGCGILIDLQSNGILGEIIIGNLSDRLNCVVVLKWEMSMILLNEWSFTAN